MAVLTRKTLSSSAPEITGLVLVSFLSLATVKISETAGWMELPPLIPLSILALAMAAILAKIKLSAWINYPVSLALGLLTTLAFGAGSISEERWTTKVSVLLHRLEDWWEIVSEGGTAKDNLPLVLLLVGVMWLVSYFSMWLLLKQKRKWLAAVPSAAWLLLNVRYIPQPASFYYGVYLGALALFVVQLRLKDGWQPAARFSFLAFTLAISIPLLLISWAIPQASLAAYTGELKGVIESRWGRMETAFNRYFSPNPAVETNAPAPGAPLHTFGPELVLKGTVNPPESRVMTLYSPLPGYLRGATYEVYTGTGWKQTDPAAPAVGKRLDTVSEPYKMRRQITQTINVGSTTDVVFSIGQPISSSLNTVGSFPTPMAFTVPVDGSLSLYNLPEDVQKAGQELIAYYSLRRSPSKSKDQARARPSTPGFNLKRFVRDGNELKAIEIVREGPEIDDVLALRNPSALKPGSKYTVVSSLSTASYVELREATEPYPTWITDRYLQLPKNLPDSVRQISYEVTRAGNNAYDKALAIEIYLRQMGYSTSIKTPPPNVDVVEYFLFKAPEGYCNYFATAMVVMLRTIGIPARMAVGFNQGEYDLEQEAYFIKESNAHAWPEVFFPEYGWVEFEPTPSQPLLAHEPPSPFIEEEEPEVTGLNEDTETGGWLTNRTAGTIFGALVFVFIMALVIWNLSFRGLSLPSRVYEKMRRFGQLARVAPRSSETPAEYAGKLEAELPDHTREIEAITSGYLEATFGKKSWDRSRLEELELAWRPLRKALLRHAVRLG